MASGCALGGQCLSWSLIPQKYLVPGSYSFNAFDWLGRVLHY